MIHRAWAPVAVALALAAHLNTAAAAGNVPFYPQREAFYGDLHLHTIYSFDAYRFAKGESVSYLGQERGWSSPIWYTPRNQPGNQR